MHGSARTAWWTTLERGQVVAPAGDVPGVELIDASGEEPSMTPTSEFQDFLDELPQQWGSTEGFALRSDYMDRVRASSLTADEVGRLRDEV